MKLYLAGPMTGLPQFNFPAFGTAADQLREAGHEVVSPHEVPLPCGCTGLPPQCDAAEHGWEEFLRADLVALLGHAEGVAVLRDWEYSRGARLEVHVATQLGLTVMPVADWLDPRVAPDQDNEPVMEEL